MNAYDAYKKYVAIKLHFQRADYDYFKFSGKVRVSKEKFEIRNDKYFFERIAKLYNDKQFEQLLVSNFISDKDVWIGNIISEKGRQTYLDWKKTIQSLEYAFSQDMLKLKSIVEESELMTFNTLFQIQPDSNWPELVQIVFQQGIKLESFIIMNKILNFMPKFNKKIEDPLVWPEFNFLCQKYTPFLSIDVPKYKSIMKDVFI